MGINKSDLGRCNKGKQKISLLPKNAYPVQRHVRGGGRHQHVVEAAVLQKPLRAQQVHAGQLLVCQSVPEHRAPGPTRGAGPTRARSSLPELDLAAARAIVELQLRKIARRRVLVAVVLVLWWGDYTIWGRAGWILGEDRCCFVSDRCGRAVLVFHLFIH